MNPNSMHSGGTARWCRTGLGGLVQGGQRVGGLLRPGPVEVRAGLGDRDELPQDVGTA